MGTKMSAFLLFSLSQILVIAAETDPLDLTVLNTLKEKWKNLPSNWVGSDPCGSGWDGINCTGSRVTSVILQGMGVKGTDFGDISSFSALENLDLSNNKGLKGTLPSSIGNLKNLSHLILVGCNLFGPIPESIGSLQNLVFLGLSSNSFTEPIPHSIGNLSKLTRLDLNDNKLTGSIPISSGTLPGLDMLVNTLHFHLGKNQLSGAIPSQLFSSNMNLLHVCIDNNQLTGNIPPSLGYVQTLEVVRLDSNLLNGTVPQNINNLTNLKHLHLSNNKLNGPVPSLTGMKFLSLTGMKFLSYVDLSNNSFRPSNIPLGFTVLESLNTLLMECTQVQGEIPVELFSSPHLETLILSYNQLSGTLDTGMSQSNQLRLIDLQNNSIEHLKGTTRDNTTLILVNNPICKGMEANERSCGVKNINFSFPNASNNCRFVVCRPDKTLSRNCSCTVPYTGTLYFIYFSFFLDISSYFLSIEEFLMDHFQKEKLPVDSVSVNSPHTSFMICRQLTVQVFPSGRDSFNRTEIAAIGNLLNRQNADLLKDFYFGPFYYVDESYPPFGGAKRSLSAGIIIGVAVAISLLVLLVLTVGVYAFRQKKRAEQARAQLNPFASWDPQRTGDSIPSLQGARWFSFMELKKCTNEFSEANSIGSGGYGKVYRGTLPTGILVAIKRAQQGSLQGAIEFKTEIELLSRIHHKNVVSLVGFCYEEGEQILVYEYIPNGTLMESLSGKSGIQLDWMRRLRIALDSARGLSYLHELANPPIIHRDIKSTNILLDNNLNAKVADFGLSKPLADTLEGYITTQVKGTPGYMDPEYYRTRQLTEKSDVYSFGVVLLELITGRRPIERGKHIVTEVNEARNRSKDKYNLQGILDSSIEWGASQVCLEKFLELALRCVNDSSVDRPKMGDVVREIENIIGLASSNLNSEPTFTSSSFDGETDGNTSHFYGSEVSVDHSRSFVPFHMEHQRGRAPR